MRKIILSLFLSWLMIVPLQANTIIVVGNSLSAAYQIQPGRDWVSLLDARLKQQGFNYQVVNISTSGDTTLQGLTKLEPTLKQYSHPDVVIIELGANDGLSGLSLDDMKSNLEKMITLSKNAGAKVLLLETTLPPRFGKKFLADFARVYTELDQQDEQVLLVPMFLAGVAGNPQLMMPDEIHPNMLAQEKLVENIWPTLLPLLKK